MRRAQGRARATALVAGLAPGRARTTALVAGVAAALATAGCNEGLLYDAAEPRVAQISIQPSLAQTTGGVLDAYASVDNITLTFATGDDTRLTETLVFNGAAEQVEISIQVPLREASETFQLSAELRGGTDALFRGTAELQMAVGAVSTVELPLQPVLAQVVCGGAAVVLDAYGATAQLTAAALFATGDTIPGQPISWSSSSPAVATVQPSGLVTAVADGETTIRCAVGDVAGSRAVQVSAVVTSVTVTPATAAVAPGGTQAFTAALRDRRGNLLTGRPVAWSSATPAVATVNATGVATGVAAGTARIDASSGTVTGSATLTVAAVPPVVVTSDASGLSASGATLNGTVNPRGMPTQAWFEYGTSATLTTYTSTPQQSVGSGTTAVSVNRSLTQLQSNTTYYFRVAASNAAGTTRGAIRSFRLVAPPLVTTLPVTVPGVVTFNGETNPRGLSTQAWFEWGTSPSLATYSSTQTVNAGSGQTTVPVSMAVSGLAPATDYYVRLAAQSAAGTTRGAIVHYRTAAAGPPAVETIDSNFDGSNYQLFGMVDPNGALTQVWFEYSFNYADLVEYDVTSSQLVDGNAGVVQFVETLPFQSSVMWFRAAAGNEFGTVRGGIQEAYAFSMANWGRPPMIPHASLRILALLLAALLLPVAAAAQQQQPDRRPGIAVLPFELGISIGTERETLDALSVGVQQILITELAQNPALRIVDRSIVRDLMAEQDLGATGRIDAQTAARIGRMVGARYVVAGGFNDNDGNFRLDGRIVDVETTEVLKADQVTDRRSNLYGIIMSLGNRLVQGVELPALPREVRSERESRGASIPREAVVLYSQAQFFADRGQTDRARELYRRITTEFPQMTEAQEALRQIGVEG